MTTPPNDTIEQLAKELKDKYNFKNGWKLLALDISRMIIESRIDEVKIARLTNGHSTNNKIRMEELEHQIAGLQ